MHSETVRVSPEWVGRWNTPWLTGLERNRCEVARAREGKSRRCWGCRCGAEVRAAARPARGEWYSGTAASFEELARIDIEQAPAMAPSERPARVSALRSARSGRGAAVRAVGLGCRPRSSARMTDSSSAQP